MTDRAIEAAFTGKSIAGPMRTRILKAVNRILKQKKQEPVQLGALFDLPAKGGAAVQASEAHGLRVEPHA